MIKKQIIFDNVPVKRKDWSPLILFYISETKQMMFVNKAFNFLHSGIFMRNYKFYYKYYLQFLYKLKKVNTVYLYKHYLTNKNNFILHPSYDYFSKYFTKHTSFKDYLNNFHIKGFFLNVIYLKKYFLNNKLFNQYCDLYGNNFYTYNVNNQIISKLDTLLQDSEHSLILNIKLLYDSFYKSAQNDHLYFNYNYFITYINIIELYVIYTLLTLNVCTKNL